jgi:hypothetical protein
MSNSSTLSVLVTADTSALQKGMDAAASSVKSFSSAVTAVAAPLAALAGVSFGGFALFDQLKNISSIGSAAKTFGETTENMSALAFAAKKSGLDLDSFAGIAHHMTRELGEAQRGSAEAQKTFASLNIDFAKFGELGFADQLKVAADRISGMNSPAEKMAVSMQLFGKSGSELLPFLNRGSAGIQELMHKASASGQVFGQDAVQGYKNFKQAIQEVQDIVQGVFTRIAVATVPVLNAIGDWVKGAIAYGQDLYNEFAPEITQLKDVVVEAFTSIGEMIISTWNRTIDGGRIVLSWFTALANFHTNTTTALAYVEVGFQNWWLVLQRVFIGAGLIVLTYVNDFGEYARKLINILLTLQQAFSRGVEGTMDDIKLIIESKRPFSPMEKQLVEMAANIDKELGVKLEAKIKERLGFLAQPAKLNVAANALPDVGLGAVAEAASKAGKVEPAAAVQQGSVEAMSAIYKSRDAKTDAQIAEAKKQTMLLQQIAAVFQAANNVALQPLAL